MRFTAYYTEDRVYRGDYDDWLEMPAEGLLIVIEHRSTGRGVFDGGDWYYVEGGEIKYIASKEWGTWQDPPAINCQSCIKKAGVVTEAQFIAVTERAMRETRGNT